MFVPAPAPTSEIINFNLEFDSEYWNQPPVVDIYLNDIHKGVWIIDSKNFQINFQHQLEFGVDYTLEIQRSGKTPDQTREITPGEYQTQTLTINKISIDRINMQNIVWHSCTFAPEYPEPWATQMRDSGVCLEEHLQGEMTLGHNGVWKFTFGSPVYKFLVDFVRGERE